jgi:hypothetical protein
LLSAFLLYGNYTLGKENHQLDKEKRLLEQKVTEQGIEINWSKDRLERYKFVGDLLDRVLKENTNEQMIAANLISLALKKEEAERLFQGLTTSSSAKLRTVGFTGTGQLAELVKKMNESGKTDRVNATKELVQQYRDDPVAVDLSVGMLEGSQLDQLSANGRINVLVFLTAASESAWSPENIARAEMAVENIRKHSNEGIAIGPTTSKRLSMLSERLKELKLKQ